MMISGISFEQNDVIEENDSKKGKRKIITWDDVSKSGAKIFIR